MGLIDLLRSRRRGTLRDSNQASREGITRKYFSVADKESMERLASREGKLVKWYSIDGKPVLVVAGKKALEIVEDEIIRLAEGMVSLQKVLGKMNAKIAALEEKIASLKDIKKEAAGELTLADVLSPSEGEKKEEPAPAPTMEETKPAEETKPEERKPEDELKPAEETKPAETSNQVTVDTTAIKNLMNVKEVKDLTLKSVNVNADGNVEVIFEAVTEKGTVTASIEKLSNGNLVYKEASPADPTKFTSGVWYDPATKVIKPFPKGEGPAVMVEVEKKDKPTGERTEAHEDVEKSQKPKGELNIAVSEPGKKKASIEKIDALARKIVSTASEKGLIEADPDAMAVIYDSLTQKDEEELETILQTLDGVDGDTSTMDEEGNIIDIREIKDTLNS